MKPVCVPCERFMRVKKNDFAFLEGKPHGSAVAWDGKSGKDSIGWTPYKLWLGDLWECPDCSSQIIVGVGRERVAEHYEPSFADAVEYFGANRLLVKDC